MKIRFLKLNRFLVWSTWSMSFIVCTPIVGFASEPPKAIAPVSNKIDELAQSLDLYLAEKEYSDEPNQTSISLHTVSGFSPGGEREFSGHGSAKLHLPNFQKKWRLAFTTHDTSRNDGELARTREINTAPEKSFGAALEFFQDLGGITTRFEPRLQAKETIEVLYFFEISSDAEVDNFYFQPVLEFFANPTDGTGQFFSLNFGYRFDERIKLTVINEEQYTDADNTMSTSHGMRLDWSNSKVWQTSYLTLVNTDNRPIYRATEYQASFRLTHKFQPNFFHYSVRPNVSWPRSDAFYRKFGLELATEVIF